MDWYNKWPGKLFTENLKRLGNTVGYLTLKILLTITHSDSDSFKSINIPEGVRYLPHSLRYLVWHHYPLKSLPVHFEPNNLVKLNMSSNNLQELWNGVQNLRNLKDVDLSWSMELVKLPGLSQAPKLQNMGLRGCKSLCQLPNISASIEYLDLAESGIEDLPSSFESFENLVSLDLNQYGCLRSLLKLPTDIKSLKLFSCVRLESLPSNIWKLKFLHELNLSHCSRLKILPKISEITSHLQTLCLLGTGIQELPLSIMNLIGLDTANLSLCENLKFAPNYSFTSSSPLELHLEGCSILGCIPSLFLSMNLTSLKLSYCNIPEIPDWLGSLSSLKKLHLRGSKFDRITSSIKQLHNLIYLNISHCKNLRHFPELPSSMAIVEVNDCTSLETVGPYHSIQV
ncbi:Leucine-rich repeat [Trema orientale]|uniref:Leucine-rich repeat n=1 Tax=Trema orientale TaxID=63057 RepID=A0A2P5ARR4_TREOI|nr:Leucine-rich repeat [Trema orientale]